MHEGLHEGPDDREHDPVNDPAEDPGGSLGQVGMERVLTSSLNLVYIPVVVLLLAGLGAFVYGTYVFAHSVRRIVDHPFPIGHHIGLFLLDVDLFLIGATLLISAVGFYELFIKEIHRGPGTRLPGWLEMHDLNDLKGRVIAMIVLVVSVSFVEVVVDAPSGRQALDLGAGIAFVIVALTVFLRLSGHGGESG
jgi:uncharacterized membrane protein YqhA